MLLFGFLRFVVYCFCHMGCVYYFDPYNYFYLGKNLYLRLYLYLCYYLYYSYHHTFELCWDTGLPCVPLPRYKRSKTTSCTPIIISTSGRTSTFASTSTSVTIYITLIIIPLNFVGTLGSLVSPYLVTNVAKPRVALGSPVSCKLVAAVAFIGPVSGVLLLLWLL